MKPRSPCIFDRIDRILLQSYIVGHVDTHISSARCSHQVRGREMIQCRPLAWTRAHLKINLEGATSIWHAVTQHSTVLWHPSFYLDFQKIFFIWLEGSDLNFSSRELSPSNNFLYGKSFIWIHPRSIFSLGSSCLSFGLKTAQSRQKSYYDQKHREVSFEPGDYVYLRVSPMRGLQRFKIKAKLAPRFIGPFCVVARRGTVAYQLDLPKELSDVHAYSTSHS